MVGDDDLVDGEEAQAVIEEFGSAAEHREYLKGIGDLPQGFSVGNADLTFTPAENPDMSDLPMRLTLMTLDEPSNSWTALFTKNVFPGAPVLVGRSRLAEGTPLQAIIVNNKVSNVCAGGPAGAGVSAAEEVCASIAAEMGLESPTMVLPCSTGVIGWALPKEAIISAVPLAVAALQPVSAFPAAEGIMTTDRYPKLRSVTLSNGGRVVAFAKGAGMIEPHLATMLVYILTDVQVERTTLDKMLREAVNKPTSFNSMSVDSDESTSDTVVAVSSNMVTCSDEGELAGAISQVCAELSDDVVRNGEGTNHVLEVAVTGGPSDVVARELGRTVVNSPLVKCAVAGNDPNVGRIVAAAGKFVGELDVNTSTKEKIAERLVIRMGGRCIFQAGQFRLSSSSESELIAHMKAAELGDDGQATFPAHKRKVEVEIDLGAGEGKAVVLGSDLTHEYVSINADYRS